uniref:DRB sensitivity-inducing factor large subunit n=1 Tax=Parastrongyloides trichosuri TaxID=131310 RepID=A0A0N4ZEX3_PARTI
MIFTIYYIFLFIPFLRFCKSSDMVVKLYHDLLRDYESDVRPSIKHDMPINVTFSFALRQIIDVDEKNQIITTNAWINQKWNDYKVVWDPRKYDNITQIHIAFDKLWKPDIVLYNNADSGYTKSILSTDLIVNYQGNVTWISAGILKSSCPLDVRYYPFDSQSCYLKFASWAYDGTKINILLNNESSDQSYYITSTEWHLTLIQAEKQITFYSCCDEAYPYIDIMINIQRRPLFYVFNLILPCILISAIALLGFYMPSDSGEKVTLGITSLLSTTVFLMLVAEGMPPTSEALPLIGIYYGVTIFTVSLATAMTVFTLNIHHHGIQGKNVPSILQFLAFKVLAPIMFLRIDEYHSIIQHVEYFYNKNKRKSSSLYFQKKLPVNIEGECTPEEIPSFYKNKNSSETSSINANTFQDDFLLVLDKLHATIERMLKFEASSSDEEKGSTNQFEKKEEFRPVQESNLKLTIKRPMVTNDVQIQSKRGKCESEGEISSSDESEDEVVRRPGRKVNPFISDDVSEEEVEDDSEGSDLEEEEAYSDNEVEETSRRRRGFYRNVINRLNEDDLNAYFQSKYNNEDGEKDVYYSDSEEDNEEIDPTILRPGDGGKLWIIKTKIGEAKNVARLLQNKLSSLKRDNPNINITSVISKTTENSYVYVHSGSSIAVENFIKGTRGILNQKLKAVRDEDFVDTIREKKERINLKVGAFIRFKRTKYAGDLAQIIQIDEEDELVLLKVVPRIDYNKVRGQLRLEMTERDLLAEKKRKHKRIPRALFDPMRVKKKGGDFVLNKGIYIFEKDDYANGFLFKWFKTSLIETEGVMPTSEELKAFDNSILGGDDMYSSLSSVANVNVKLEVGEKVQLLEEQYDKLMGDVFEVKGDNVVVKISNQGDERFIKVSLSNVGKYFNIGDHIKVTNGKNASDTGIVVKCDGGVVFYISDLTKDENKVAANNCVLSLEVTAGVDSCGKYSYLDFVKLDESEVGVIVKIVNNTITILNQYNNIITRSPNQIREKILSRNGRCFDMGQNELVAGSQVIIQKGNYASKSISDKKSVATVKFVCRGFLFVQDSTRKENGGYFVVKQRDVMLYGKDEDCRVGRKNIPHANKLENGIFPSLSSNTLSNNNFGINRNSISSIKNDAKSLVGKMIKISQGPYKGYVGMAKSISDNVVRIELTTNCKTISVDVSRITPIKMD